MTVKSRHQRDLFETPVEPKSIPASAEALMLELLKVLLTEVLASVTAEASDESKEADGDEDQVANNLESQRRQYNLPERVRQSYAHNCSPRMHSHPGHNVVPLQGGEQSRLPRTSLSVIDPT